MPKEVYPLSHVVLQRRILAAHWKGNHHGPTEREVNVPF